MKTDFNVTSSEANGSSRSKTSMPIVFSTLENPGSEIFRDLKFFDCPSLLRICLILPHTASYPGLKMRFDTLHITAHFRDGPLVQEFLSSHDHSVRSSQKKNVKTGMIDCFRTFNYPPTTRFPMFEFAKIDHFLMNKILPVRINDVNLTHLTTLLSGCSFYHMRLHFDGETVSNLQRIPAFVAGLKVKHIEFAIIWYHAHDRLIANLNGRLAYELIKVGVNEVTFSGSDREYLPYVSRELILDFFGAGIERINVNRGVLQDCFSEHDLLIRKMSEMKKPLRLKFHCNCNKYDEAFRIGVNLVEGVNVQVPEFKHKKEEYNKPISIHFD